MVDPVSFFVLYPTLTQRVEWRERGRGGVGDKRKDGTRLRGRGLSFRRMVGVDPRVSRVYGGGRDRRVSTWTAPSLFSHPVPDPPYYRAPVPSSSGKYDSSLVLGHDHPSPPLPP